MGEQISSNAPTILISSTLAEEVSIELPALRKRYFVFDGQGHISLRERDTFPPADSIVAIVSDQSEHNAVSKAFASLGRSGPEILIRPPFSELNCKILEKLVALMLEGRAREASLLEAVYSMREEAEETRTALQRLRRTSGPPAPQSLVAIRLDELADGDIEFQGTFHFSVRTQLESYGLTAIGLCLFVERVLPGDTVEVQLLGEERGLTLGAWRISGSDLPTRREWTVLDFPVSIAIARQSIAIRVTGSISRNANIYFARSDSNRLNKDVVPVALRLYTSNKPRFAWSRFWVGALEEKRPHSLAVAIPAHCWLGAWVAGVGSPAQSWHTQKRVRLQGRGASLIVFPEVPLAHVSSIAVHLKGRDPGEVSAALALLPTDWDRSGDLEAAVSQALCWSPLQTIRASEAAITLALPPKTPLKSHIGVALVHNSLPANETAVVVVEGVWLLQQFGQADVGSFSTRSVTAAVRDTDYEDVRLDEAYAETNYRHLDISVFGLSEAGHVWPTVKFKLFEHGGAPGLEFRVTRETPDVFVEWPGTETDRFGPYYKLSGASAIASAIAILPQEPDRRLLAALEDILLNLVRDLTARGDIREDDSVGWLSMARRLGPTSSDVDAQ